MKVRALAGVATLQDGGRPGWRHFGVPPSGIWDRESAALANALVGNPPATTVLELALGTIEIEAEATATLACVGTTRDSRLILRAGESLRIGPPRRARAYVAVPSGFEARQKMGSVSGTAVEVGTVLAPMGVRGLGQVSLADPPATMEDRPLRILPGPQSHQFDLGAFAAAAYRVHILSDRVGIRLKGASLPEGEEIVSEPACPGAIQITGGGQPIVLGPDGPTIGGYPKIAVVCEADLDRLAQLRPGDLFAAEWIDADEALEAAQERDRRLSKRLETLRLSLDPR